MAETPSSATELVAAFAKAQHLAEEARANLIAWLKLHEGATVKVEGFATDALSTYIRRGEVVGSGYTPLSADPHRGTDTQILTRVLEVVEREGATPTVNVLVQPTDDHSFAGYSFSVHNIRNVEVENGALASAR